MNVYEANKIIIPEGSVGRILDMNNVVLWEKSYDYSSPFYIEDLSGKSNTLTIVKTSSSLPSLTIEKSLDGAVWENMGSTSTTAITATIPANGKLYLRCLTNSWASESAANIISASKNHAVGGNIMSLLMGSSFVDGNYRFAEEYVFSGLFYENDKLIRASNLLLPDIGLTKGCYERLFYGCSLLIDTPVLRFTSTAEECCMDMYRGCTSLTTVRALPHANCSNGCYAGMYQGCTSLVNVPDFPDVGLADSCYSDMFYNCTSLVSAPTLPATTLAFNCYHQMFGGCTSLVNAPVLPATSLYQNCYSGMFRGCTSLVNAPVLPATTLPDYCYEYMFKGCTSLATIRCNAININYPLGTWEWVTDVPATGTFYKNSNMSDWRTNVSGIPEGWTVRNL